jgi:hypothetical protein
MRFRRGNRKKSTVLPWSGACGRQIRGVRSADDDDDDDNNNKESKCVISQQLNDNDDDNDNHINSNVE